MNALGFGCRLVTDLDQYPAGWGARLIYQEVTAGGTGIVWDRTDTFGEQEDKDKLLGLMNDGVMKQAMNEARRWIATGEMHSGSDVAFDLYEGHRIKVVASPQGSYGYLYITAVLLP